MDEEEVAKRLYDLFKNIDIDDSVIFLYRKKTSEKIHTMIKGSKEDIINLMCSNMMQNKNFMDLIVNASEIVVNNSDDMGFDGFTDKTETDRKNIN